MNSFSVSATDPLSTLETIGSEIIYLEPEHFERAAEISERFTEEAQRWQIYLNILALSSFEEWLYEQVNNLLISTNYNSVVSTPFCHLKIGEFDICLIVTESLTNEIITLPNAIIDSAEKFYHFYVIIEILEEQEEAIICGCLRYDKLVHYRKSFNLSDELPVSLFDAEVNHLLFALRLLSPRAILFPLDSLQFDRDLSQTKDFSKRITNLNSWLSNICAADWLPIEDLLNAEILRRRIVWQLPLYRSEEQNQQQINKLSSTEEIIELINQLSVINDKLLQQKAAKRLGIIARGNEQAILALCNLLQTTEDDETLWIFVETLWQISPGNIVAGIRRVKLIDLGMQIAGKSIALAVAIVRKVNNKFGILLRVYPTNDEPYLATNLKLIVLDDSGQEIYQIIARKSDNYIQLKLNAQKGELFSVRIALGNANITEHFEI